MVTWFADGGVSGFVATVGQTGAEVYKLASPGTVDTNGVTRLQYNRGDGSGVTAQDRITAVARLRITSTDLANNGIGSNGRRLGATLFVIDAVHFPKGKVPTPAEIRDKGPLLRAFRSTTWRTSNAPGDYTFNIPGPRASQLQANAKYWVMVVPTTWLGYESPSYANDRAVEVGNENQIARALSVWANRTPAAPVITKPVSGSVIPAGSEVDFTVVPKDPDEVFGANNPFYRDVSGFQVQYAPKATAANPNPVWRDITFTSVFGPAVEGAGWWIDGAASLVGANFDRNSGAQNFWNNLTGKIRCGSNTLSPGTANLPSGDWQIRARTFDYGTANPNSGNVFGKDNGSYTPDTAPGSNTSEWSKPVTVSISAQVPAPVPVSPINGTAVQGGQPITFIWQYRNTANPPKAQASRTVQIRLFGQTAWSNLVSGNSSQPTHTIVAGAVDKPFHYEWRVQVTDTDGVVSNYSDAQSFFIVPAAASGVERPLPTDTVEGATLGCGTHRAFIFRRGGKERVGEVTELSYLDWGRVRDDLSSAQVVASGWSVDCGNLLARLQCWAYELVIFRDNGYGVERVWEGPITMLRYEQDKVTIQAKDVMAYAYRRIIKQIMNDNSIGDTVVNRATRVVQNAFAPDDPNVLAYLRVLARADDAKQFRSLPAYSRTAFEEVDDMAANSGLDYCTVGRSILLWGTKHRIGTLPEFRDEDLGAPPIVTEYGMAFANRYAVSDGNGVYGEATRLNAQGEDPIYGHVEMLSSTWASDSPEEAGTYTEEGLATVRKSFAEYAERSIADRYPPPVTVRVPDNTTLNPGTVLNIQELVPGVALPLRSSGTLRKVVATQKLDSVKVVETAGTETITITLSQFSRDDAVATEGEEV